MSSTGFRESPGLADAGSILAASTKNPAISDCTALLRGTSVGQGPLTERGPTGVDEKDAADLDQPMKRSSATLRSATTVATFPRVLASTTQCSRWSSNSILAA